MPRFQLGVVIGIAHDQRVTLCPCRLLYSMNDGHGKRVAYVGDQHAQQSGSAAFQAPCHLVGGVAKALGRLIDTRLQGSRQPVSLRAEET